MKTLAIANQKGGVGKSTIAVHVAHHAAEQGMRVLVIDVDEADLSEVFAQEEEGAKHLKASQLFTGKTKKLQPRQVDKNIWLVDADVEVADVDDMNLGVITKPREVLAAFQDQFDLVVIDTPPNLQRRMLGALTAADAVVTPFNISPFSLHRLPRFMTTVANIQAEYNPKLRLLGLLPSLINSKSSNEVEALPELRDAYGELVFEQAIITRACIPTALAQGRPVWRGAKSGNQRAAAKEMRAACVEIFERLAQLD